jgi:anti-sigma regulatory factor (Ser/Thr protein kinase)
MGVSTESPDWTYLQSWPGVAADVSAARHFVAQRLETHHLHALVPWVSLVASELATNAVRHAGTPFTVTLEQTDGVVVLGVEDGSPTVPRQMPWDSSAPGGRGLFLVNVYAQECGVTLRSGATHGKLVWARFIP